MNKDELIGDWKIVKGKIKEQWSDLTDDELLKIEGKKDQLVGTLQKKYGITREQAEQEFSNFKKRVLKDSDCGSDFHSNK